MLISKKLFVERYTDLQERIFPMLIDSQSEQKLRYSPEGMNAPIWIYWHIVRTEDVGINRFIMDREQEYKKWSGLVNIPTSYNGTGMSKSDVKKLTHEINLSGLIQYRLAVMASTLEAIQRLTKEELIKVSSATKVKQIICDENVMPESVWHLLNLYYGKSKEWFLLHSCLTHPFYHLGQMNTILKKD